MWAFIILGIFIFILYFLSLIFYDSHSSGDKDANDTSWILGSIGTLILAVLTFAAIIQRDVSYKTGQIDAINGTINYHLVKQADSTIVWEEIKED